MTRPQRKNPNRAGTDARKRKDGRYETRATLNTLTSRRRVSFYGDTAEEANNKKFQALADQVRNSADTRNKPRVTATKTGQKRRVAIGPRTVEVLTRHRARHARSA